MKNKLYFIEIARGLAALLVLLRHATLNASAFYGHTPFNNLFAFGDAAVDFFFVLSGFIIFYVHGNDDFTSNSVKKYMLKRIIRIYPIFLLISIGLLLAYFLFPGAANRVTDLNFWFVFKSLLLLPSKDGYILGVSWTLVHEMFFYIIFITVIYSKYVGLSVFVLWGVSIVAYNLFLGVQGNLFDFIFSKYNLEFLFGVLAAFIFKTNTFEYVKRNQSCILLLGIVVFIINGLNAVFEIFGSLPAFYETLIYCLASFSIVLGLLRPMNYSLDGILMRVMLALGSASYSIYLSHNVLLSIFHRIVKKLELSTFIPPNLIFLCLVMICSLFGFYIYKLVEKPMLNKLRYKLIK